MSRLRATITLTVDNVVSPGFPRELQVLGNEVTTIDMQLEALGYQDFPLFAAGSGIMALQVDTPVVVDLTGTASYTFDLRATGILLVGSSESIVVQSSDPPTRIRGCA